MSTSMVTELKCACSAELKIIEATYKKKQRASEHPLNEIGTMIPNKLVIKFQNP